MNANTRKLEKARALLRSAIALLDEAGAPAGIAAHADLAVVRLESFLSMIRKWGRGSPSDKTTGT